MLEIICPEQLALAPDAGAGVGACKVNLIDHDML